VCQVIRSRLTSAPPGLRLRPGRARLWPGWGRG